MTRLENFAVSTLSHNLYILHSVNRNLMQTCFRDNYFSVARKITTKILMMVCYLENASRPGGIFLHEVPKKFRSLQVLFQIITFYGRVLRSIILRWASEGRKLFGCNNRLFKQYVSLQFAYETLFELSRFGDLCVWNSEHAAKTVDDRFVARTT
jgi:hypothetical protein